MFAIQSPFPIFIDTNDFPLTAGNVWIGIVNENPETTPLATYWDADGTIPAVQPIPTLNGSFVRDGTPANVFVTDDFSITVRNKQGILVYTQPSSNSSVAGLLSNIDYSSRLLVATMTLPAAQLYFRVQGYDSPGDGGAGLYVEVENTGSLFPHQFRTNSSTRRWQYAPDGGTIRPEVVGQTGLGDDFATLVSVDIAAQALNVDILLTKRSDIAEDHQFRSHVRFEGAGALFPVAGAQIDFLSGFTASPDYKIFDLSNGSMTTHVDSPQMLVDRLTPNMFGAVGDFTTLCDDAFSQCIETALTSGLEVHIPGGQYKFANPLIVEINSGGGFIMRGLGGAANVILDFTGMTITDAGFIIQDTTNPARHLDNLVLENFTVRANSGTVHRLGANDYTDLVISPRYEGMIFINDTLAGGTESVVINRVNNGYFNMNVTGGEIGIVLRNASLNKFYGQSVGTAFAINFANTGEVNFGNTFFNMSLDGPICVGVQNGAATNNQFIGGLWSYSVSGYQDNAGGANTVVNPVTTGVKDDFMHGNGTGVTILHGLPTDFPPGTPPFAGFGVAMTNTCGQSIDVEFTWSAGGTTVSGFERNAVPRSAVSATEYLSFHLNPGDDFKLTGSGTPPTMLWSN